MQIIYMKKKVESIFKFIQAFKAWEAKNPLTPIQEKLLLRIMFRVNENHWEEWTPISNTELILEMRVNKPTLIRNRDHLKSLGILRYKKGSKGRRSFFGLNMPIAETTYVFPENENKVSPEIPKNENKKNKVSPEIPKTLPKTLPNESETPHEQCVPDALKHINDKHINNNSIIRNINITHNTLIAESEKISHEQMNNDIVSLFNKICSNLPKVSKLSKKRTQLLAKLFKSGYTQQEFKQVFEMANNSDFLCGKTANSTFRANFDWILNENNFIKVLEGNYANFDNQNLSDGINQERKPSYNIDEYRGYCQNILMRSRSTDGFSEALKEELSRPEHIEVEVT